MVLMNNFPHTRQLQIHASLPYGSFRSFVNVLALIVFCVVLPVEAMAKRIVIVAFGDSLTAGFGLRQGEGFTDQLQASLRKEGHDVIVRNAGVSGDTTAGGLARFDWAVGPDTDAVILELGANDALRGMDPAVTRQNLSKILARLQKMKVPVLLTGMRAPPNYGRQYQTLYDGLFPQLADQYDALFYPFFLDGVAAKRQLNQSDGIHPNAKGVAIIVDRMLDSVEDLIDEVD
jgi:acyl-CoA thioesterase-1